MKHITQAGNVFRLAAGRTALLLQITKYGHAELLHYGGILPMEDAPAMAARRTMPYGSEVMYTEDDPVYCLDNIPLLWSGSGKGDFRIPPIELELPDGTFTTDFIYESCTLRPGTLPAVGLPAAYDETGEAETLVLSLREKKYALRLELVFTVFPGADVITRRTVLHNEENSAVIIRRLMSMQIDLPQREYEMITLDGDWISEAHIHTRPVQPGCIVNESTTGASSNRHNPGVLLAEQGAGEDSGLVYGFNLLYSGSHYTAVERSPRDFVRVVSGIQPQGFCWRLPAGEMFRTPEEAMTVSAEGRNGVSGNFHRFIRENILRGEWKKQPRPVLLNNWEAHFFDFNEAKLLALAKQAKAVGAELFVLDDGWFGERNSDTAGLGDYTVNRKKLPQGMNGLAEKITAMGLRFGLWFEPEAVNPDSDLYRAHPDWAIQVPGRELTLCREQYVLDYSRQDVREYVYGMLRDILTSADISYVKWDMNRQLTEVGSRMLPADRQRELWHRYVLGVYEMMERLVTEFPDLLLENCSGGGARFDPGMLYYSPQIWASDDTDAMERLKIQYGTSLCYPVSAMGAHVSDCPNHTVGRTTPFQTRGHVAMAGTFGYELDITKISPEDRGQIPGQIADYKRYSHIMRNGDQYRIGDPFGTAGYDAWIFVAKDKGEALFTYVQTLSRPNVRSRRIRLKGLNPESWYRCSENGKTYSGAYLMQAGLRMPNLWGDFQSRQIYLNKMEERA